ncbi:MAG: CU044_2847 family protein [Cyanobacteria bacterium P01_F01_bin.53]
MSDNITQPVSLELEDGTRLWVEARSLGGEEDVGIGDVLKFEEVTKVVGGIAKGLKQTFDMVKPKKAAVEFGLEVGLESGKLTTLLVQDEVKANLKITLEWGE